MNSDRFRIFGERPFGLIILIGCLFTLLFALCSRGNYHPDEHFQILEYARLKLFGAASVDYLPWEYHAMMRSGFQPFIAWAAGRLLLAVGLYTPFALVTLLQLVSGLFSVVAMLVFFRIVHDKMAPLGRKWFLLIGFFLWFMAYLHVHFSAEMFAGNLLLLLVALTLRYREHPGTDEFRQGLVLGLIAGLIFVVRYQAGFALAGYGIWLLVYSRRWRLFAAMALGVCAALAMGQAADYWLYGEWTLVPFNYLRENIFNAHMDEFGISPWWYYFTEGLREGGYFVGALVLVAMLWFFIRCPRHVITWMLVPFLLVHFFLGHKELRFFFPALFFAPYFLGVLLDAVPPRIFAHRGWKWAVGVFAVTNLAVCVYGFGIGRENDAYFRMVWNYCQGKGPVVALDVKERGNPYAYFQLVKNRYMVENRFYMPENFTLLFTDTPQEVGQKARELAADGVQSVILSHNAWLAETYPLPLKKLEWSPYPGWVRRYLNFNGWTRFAVRSRNVYEVEFPATEVAP